MIVIEDDTKKSLSYWDAAKIRTLHWNKKNEYAIVVIVRWSG